VNMLLDVMNEEDMRWEQERRDWCCKLAKNSVDANKDPNTLLNTWLTTRVEIDKIPYTIKESLTRV
jgi:hypothetical protein